MAQYEEWLVSDFSGGVVDAVEDTLLQDNQLADARNVVCEQLGRIVKRRGQVYLNSVALDGAVQGLHAYYYKDAQEQRKLVAAAKGVVYSWNGSTFTQLKDGLHATADVMFATTINYMVAFNGTDTPWKWDGTTVTNLENAPAAGRCPVLFKEKLFVIVDADTVVWSREFEPETWEAVNYAEFDKGDGDELTLLIQYLGELYLFKTRSIHKISGTDISDFRYTKVENRYGAVGPRAGVVAGLYLYYISTEGVMMFNGIKSVNLIDQRIPNFWKNSVNHTPTVLKKAVIWCWDNRLWVALPGKNSNSNDIVLVYDLRYGSWWIFDGINASCFTEFNDGTGVRAYTGHATHGYVIQQDTGYCDLGSAISAYLTLPNYSAKDPVLIKKFKRVFAVDANGLNDATLSYRIDNASTWVTPTAVSDSKDVRRYNVASPKTGRYFQPKFTHNTADKDFCLSGFKLLFRAKKNK